MLPGTDWRFVSLAVDGDPVDLDAQAARFPFDGDGDGGVYRMAGCNAFGGELAIEPGVLHLGSAGGTAQGCATEAQAVDDALLRFSDGDVSWSIEATGRLHLDARDVAGELERLSPEETDGRDQLDEIVLQGANWYLGFDRVNNFDSVVFAVREGPGGPWGGGSFVVPGEPFDGWVDPLPDRPRAGPTTAGVPGRAWWPDTSDPATPWLPAGGVPRTCHFEWHSTGSPGQPRLISEGPHAA